MKIGRRLDNKVKHYKSGIKCDFKPSYFFIYMLIHLFLAVCNTNLTYTYFFPGYLSQKEDIAPKYTFFRKNDNFCIENHVKF